MPIFEHCFNNWGYSGKFDLIMIFKIGFYENNYVHSANIDVLMSFYNCFQKMISNCSGKTNRCQAHECL